MNGHNQNKDKEEPPYPTMTVITGIPISHDSRCLNADTLLIYDRRISLRSWKPGHALTSGVRTLCKHERRCAPAHVVASGCIVLFCDTSVHVAGCLFGQNRAELHNKIPCPSLTRAWPRICSQSLLACASCRRRSRASRTTRCSARDACLVWILCSGTSKSTATPPSPSLRNARCAWYATQACFACVNNASEQACA
jgi:hypothetical protein